MIQMLAHGLSSAALFIMAGQLYERMHTRDLRLMGGMWGEFRYYAPMLMFFCAALLGIPGTGNFLGEFLILMGAFAQYPVFVVFATISLVLAGLYSLILIHRALFGDNNVKQVAAEQAHVHAAHAQQALHGETMIARSNAEAPVAHNTHSAHAVATKPAPTVRVRDLGKRELSLLLVLAAGLVWLGLYPQPFLDTSSEAMQWINNAYVYSEVSQIDTTQSLGAMEAR
jgi:NADH-quinone oxidoreductase subunit M